MKSAFLSQLSGICSGITLMAFLINDLNLKIGIFLGSIILSIVFLSWSFSEQDKGN